MATDAVGAFGEQLNHSGDALVSGETGDDGKPAVGQAVLQGGQDSGDGVVVVGAVGNDDGVLAEDFQAGGPLDGGQAGDDGVVGNAVAGGGEGFGSGYGYGGVGALEVAEEREAQVVGVAGGLDGEVLAGGGYGVDAPGGWIPAFAGMTSSGSGEVAGGAAG